MDVLFAVNRAEWHECCKRCKSDQEDLFPETDHPRVRRCRTTRGFCFKSSDPDSHDGLVPSDTKLGCRNTPIIHLPSSLRRPLREPMAPSTEFHISRHRPPNPVFA